MHDAALSIIALLFCFRRPPKRLEPSDTITYVLLQHLIILLTEKDAIVTWKRKLSLHPLKKKSKKNNNNNSHWKHIYVQTVNMCSSRSNIKRVWIPETNHRQKTITTKSKSHNIFKSARNTTLSFSVARISVNNEKGVLKKNDNTATSKTRWEGGGRSNDVVIWMRESCKRKNGGKYKKVYKWQQQRQKKQLKLMLLMVIRMMVQKRARKINITIIIRTAMMHWITNHHDGLLGHHYKPP